MAGPAGVDIGYEDDEDIGLVRAAQADPTHFAFLYERYRHRVYSYLRLRAGESEAEDLTQQVFVQALAALPHYSPRLPFGAWLFRIARNAAIDRGRRRRTVPWEALPANLQPIATDNPEAHLLEHETRTHLRVLLTALDPSTRELLLLRFAGRLTAREIAPVVGISETAVHKRIARALHRLKERYDELA